jgi:hypothetical protein
MAMLDQVAATRRPEHCPVVSGSSAGMKRTLTQLVPVLGVRGEQALPLYEQPSVTELRVIVTGLLAHGVSRVLGGAISFLAGSAFLCVAVLSAFSADVPADGQTESRCQTAASLWIPSYENGERPVVVKWSKFINYEIIAPDADADVKKSVDEVLRTIVSDAGLGADTSMDATFDLTIAVVPDIALAPRIRESVQRYSRLRRGTGLSSPSARGQTYP